MIATMPDDIHARLDALSQANTALWDALDALEAENERLRDRVADLERVVDPDGTATDYGSLTREQKVFQLRTALARDALEGNGRAAMTYTEVRAVFGNRPSPGHAYDLMSHAADADGFTVSETTDQKRLVVETAAVNDETVIHAANNGPVRTPA